MFTVAFIQFYSSLSTRLTGTLDILWLKDLLNCCWIPLNIFISHVTSLFPSGSFSSSKTASCVARTNVASLATGKNASGSSISWLKCVYVSRIPASAAFLRFPSEWINVEKLSFGCCNWICTRVSVGCWWQNGTCRIEVFKVFWPRRVYSRFIFPFVKHLWWFGSIQSYFSFIKF